MGSKSKLKSHGNQSEVVGSLETRSNNRQRRLFGAALEGEGSL